jgi:hypothetical protein
MPKEDDEMLEELKRIRELLEPKPTPPPPPSPKGVINEFRDFLSKYRVMGLAVAFIIGLYLGNLVQALVKNLILPMIGLALPGIGDLASLSYSLKPGVWYRRVPSGFDNFYNRRLRDFLTSQDNQEMGNRITARCLL